MNMIVRATTGVVIMLTCGIARADECQPIIGAIGKLNSATQFQQKGISATDGEKSHSIDYLVSNDKEYSRRDNGPWKISARQLVPLIIDGKSTVSECSRVGIEQLGDVSAIVYIYKRLTPAHDVRDVRLWVAESTGKPLQTVIGIDTEPGQKYKFTFSYDPHAALPTVGDQ
ncbi:hypothetical protein N2601_16975 [Rhizobium sp. CB3060]|uniref:hypothetical protein n=1 Tax=Rhizobium sp. CB3060 TaxID=3138255 RepID=UPI0021A50EF3|nr:hypothetical protein [Rhizobium tropici]UWU20934.1 hypothetical protein N2601_16975 [Rhizobium tropici]